MAKRPLSRRQVVIAAGVAVPAAALAARSATRSPDSASSKQAEKSEGTKMRARSAERVVKAQPTTDGAGVRLNRSLGTRTLSMLDPFLMLDEFFTDRPEDYIAGFPDHPHRGFETVTYMIDGAMEHKDSLGNRGRLGPGSVQWMTAGSGIIHSEMPKQQNGRMWGFQLWVNLPASLKMTKPRYQDIAPDHIPEVDAPGSNGARVRLVAGELGGVSGPVKEIYVAPQMLDVKLAAKGTFVHPLPPEHNAFVYVFDGTALVAGTQVGRGELAVLGPGDAVSVTSDDGARFLVLAGKPIGEPVARYGPFVMNTEAEIRQAVSDYQSGRLVQS